MTPSRTERWVPRGVRCRVSRARRAAPARTSAAVAAAQRRQSERAPSAGGAHRGIWGGGPLRAAGLGLRSDRVGELSSESCPPIRVFIQSPPGATKGRTPMISERSRPRRFPGPGWAVGGTACLLLLLALWAYAPLAAALGAAGSAAAQPPARSRAPQSSLGTITIQGLRQRHALGAAVDHLVVSTLVSLGRRGVPARGGSHPRAG